MNSAPTRGAVDQNQGRWLRRPGIAVAIRIFLFLMPIAIGWLAVRSTQQFFWTAQDWLGFAVWVVQAMLVAGVASYAGSRVAQRLAPLSTLFQLTLVFPDHAPSRLGIALRGGTIKKLAAAPDLSGQTMQGAAEHAVALVTQLGKHERLTRGHTERVRARAELIGAEMGLSPAELQKLRWGVLLHDIGKLKVPSNILDKPSRLTEDEWEIMSQHPEEGARIVAPLADWLGDWVHAAGQHHERWDGEGYPNRLKGTEISLAGRITAVADAYDVITSKRSYKNAMTEEAARKELVRCAGGQFDPAVVRAAIQVGLKQPHRIGLAGWLFELPAVARFASAVPSTAGAAVPAAIMSASLAVGTLVGGAADLSNPPPAALALASSDSAEFLSSEQVRSGAMEIDEMLEAVEIAATGEDDPVATSRSVGVSESSTTTSLSPRSTTTTEGAAAREPQTNDRLPGDVVVESTTTTTTAAPIARPATAVTAAPLTRPTPTTTTAAPTTTSAPTTTTAAPRTATTAPTTTTAAPRTTTTTEPPPILPTGTGIVVLAGDDVPTDLSRGTLQSDTTVYVIEEVQSTTLRTALPVVDFEQGRTRVAAGTSTTTIPSGTVVCSWLVRFAPTDAALGAIVTPTIDFKAPIVGLALDDDELDETDILAIDGVNYAEGGVGGTDLFTVTGSELELVLASGLGGLDQLRVITGC